ncbi:MAG TPA: NAD(P)H-dependent oxidoreductase [Chitinophagaceae bacterium]|jgi:glutathione-regulated potassium-efflux system ancillary protein KefG|nr:NAD(P)H-dependent oxidoreductase [Chitinophagaceae bacterium]
MSKILLLFAHPLLEKSRVQAELLQAAGNLPGVTVQDLYQRYPDFDVDVRKEQRLLEAHDLVIWQHPFYWYSAPPLLKQWMDLVLEHGWAYGKKGQALAGKKVFNVITSGGSQEAYRHGGYNKYPIHEYLRPFERTAELCHMTYYPPFWIGGVHRLEMTGIRAEAARYRNLLTALVNDIFTEEEILGQALMNDLVPLPTPKEL